MRGGNAVQVSKRADMGVDKHRRRGLHPSYQYRQGRRCLRNAARCGNGFKGSAVVVVCVPVGIRGGTPLFRTALRRVGMTGTTSVHNFPMGTDFVADGQQVEQHPSLPKAHNPKQ